MYQRSLSPLLLDALADSPVVLINGARQAGKTTLVQSLPIERHAATYINLDDANFLAAAQADAAGFLAGLAGPVVIDEVQHAPQLFPAIKLLVDRQRTPGRFLLTGSANVLLLPRLSESLAGRMEILTLWPLSQSEIEGTRGQLIDRLFAGETFAVGGFAADGATVDRADLLRRLLSGGYPEPLGRSSQARRRAWFGSYLTTILQRDVRDISNIEGLTDLPRLLTLLATRAGGLMNLADVSRAVGLPYTTLYRYMSLLETTFLVQLLPAWTAGLSRRLVKAPKIILNDTGLMASLLGLDAQRLEREGELLGSLLENFVVMELRKQAGWSQVQPQLFHYRAQTGQEVDVILEDASGRIVGIEIKASSTVSGSDFKGLRHLSQELGDRFVRGIVLYTGGSAVPFGANLHALPVSSLWREM